MTRILLPKHGPCLVCYDQDPASMGIDWYVDDEGCIHSEAVISERHQGPPGYVHGGALSAIMDDAMGMCAWANGHPVVAANLNVSFRKPVPLGQTIRIRAWVVEQRGRKVGAAGEILLPDGTAGVEASGTFVAVPQLFAETASDNPFMTAAARIRGATRGKRQP